MEPCEIKFSDTLYSDFDTSGSSEGCEIDVQRAEAINHGLKSRYPNIVSATSKPDMILPT